jgi:hypothetical protein
MQRGKNKKRPTIGKRAFGLARSAAMTDTDNEVHVLGPGLICDTDARGHASPKGRSPLELVVDASEGFIPLWVENTTLRWRFREHSLTTLQNTTATKAEIRTLLAESILQWGDAAPVKFAERNDAWDFEIVVRNADECSIRGCVLASAFFPDPGQHTLTLYPKMFEQTRKEQVDTLVHELGHVFGLRHFFAEVSETTWPSLVFGAHKPFSIMNYGSLSELTVQDKTDLRSLYQLAWSGQMRHINGTPIKLMKAFHTVGAVPEGVVAVGQFHGPLAPLPVAAYVTGK